MVVEEVVSILSKAVENAAILKTRCMSMINFNGCSLGFYLDWNMIFLVFLFV